MVELLVEQGDLESQLEVALALQVQELVLLPELVAFLLAWLHRRRHLTVKIECSWLLLLLG